MTINAEVNELLEAAKSTVDEEERVELYKRVQALVHEEVPLVPLVHSTPLLAAKSTVKTSIDDRSFEGS